MLNYLIQNQVPCVSDRKKQLANDINTTVKQPRRDWPSEPKSGIYPLGVLHIRLHHTTELLYSHKQNVPKCFVWFLLTKQLPGHINKHHL